LTSGSPLPEVEYMVVVFDFELYALVLDGPSTEPSFKPTISFARKPEEVVEPAKIIVKPQPATRADFEQFNDFFDEPEVKVEDFFGYHVPVVQASESGKRINWKLKCKYRGNPFQNAVRKHQNVVPDEVLHGFEDAVGWEEPIVFEAPKVQAAAPSQPKAAQAPAPAIVPPPAKFIPKTFDCMVCGGTHPEDDLFIASRCKHELCRECATTYIKSQYEQMYVPIRCWMHSSDCKEEITQRDIQSVLDETSMARYYRICLVKSISSPETRVVECIGKDCDFLLTLDAQDPLPPSIFCELCSTVFCPTCRVPYHSGMDCAQFRRSQDHQCPTSGCNGVVKGADLKCTCPTCRVTWCWECGINPYHEGKTCEDMFAQHFKSCPNCKVRTQKSEGCNHMRCQQCNIHWCYLCVTVLNAEHPYDHYSDRRSICYGKCFVLEDVLRVQR
jgi:hypothetical protein